MKPETVCRAGRSVVKCGAGACLRNAARRVFMKEKFAVSGNAKMFFLLAVFVLAGTTWLGAQGAERLELRLEFPELPQGPFNLPQALLTNTTNQRLYFVRIWGSYWADGAATVRLGDRPWYDSAMMELVMRVDDYLVLEPGESVPIASYAFHESTPRSRITGIGLAAFDSTGNRLWFNLRWD